MSSIFGGQVNPVPNTNPIVGHDTQNQFISALFGTGLSTRPGTQWGDPGAGVLQGVPGYTGPLSPDPSSTPVSQSVFGSYDPRTAGANLYASLKSMSPRVESTANQVDPMMSSIQQQGGMGYPLQLMHNMAQYGNTGYFNPLMSFMGARPYSSRG